MKTLTYITWLNNLGGFDYWGFTDYKDFGIDIFDSGELELNTFPNWPQSYGEYADTLNKQTFKRSRNKIILRAGNLQRWEVIALSQIKTSPLVQILISKKDKRTVIVDNASFTIYVERDKLHSISFTATYTDEIPSQTI